MRKFEIVNALVRKNSYRSYLEICTDITGGTFHRVSRNRLLTCHRLVYRCPQDFQDGGEINFRSDNEQIEGLLHASYDVVFVDAWHTFACAQRDLQYAFSLLTPGGTMVVHDCSPPDKEAAAPVFDHCPWFGVTYCAYVDFVWSHAEADSYTVDTDYGCGVVKKRASGEKEQAVLGPRGIFDLWQLERTAKGLDVFDFFHQHRRELLKLISVEDFLSREGVAGPNAFLQLARRIPGWEHIECRLPLS